MSPDGRSVYALGKNAIVRFKRNPTTGALKPEGCIAAALHPDGCATTARGLYRPSTVTVSPDGKSVYVKGLQDLARFNRDTTTGALRYAGCIAQRGRNARVRCGKTREGLYGYGDVAVSDDGNSVYATGDRSFGIAIFKRTRTNGELRPAGTAGGSTTSPFFRFPGSLVVSPDGSSVYLDAFLNVPPYSDASGDEIYNNVLAQFERHPADGALSYRDCIADSRRDPGSCTESAHKLCCSDWHHGLAVSEDGTSVYWAGGALLSFNRDPTSGGLTQVDEETAFDVVAVSEDGLSVYSSGSGGILSFNRDPISGALTPAAEQAATGSTFDYRTSVAISPDGKSVYAASYDRNAIIRFDRER